MKTFAAILLASTLLSAPAFATVTLNPADKSSTITLSNGNLTCTGDSTSNYENVRATQSFSSGKIYFEYTYNSGSNFGVSSFAPAGGLADANQVLSSYLGDGTGDSFGLFSTNTDSHAIVGNTQDNVTTVPGSIGKTFGVAFDVTNNLVWFYDGTAWNPSVAGTQDPATGQGGISTAGLVQGSPWFPTLECEYASITVNFGRQTAAYTIPTGFSWVDPPPAATCKKGLAALGAGC